MSLRSGWSRRALSRKSCVEVRVEWGIEIKRHGDGLSCIPEDSPCKGHEVGLQEHLGGDATTRRHGAQTPAINEKRPEAVEPTR
jgi:hypothetical protein